MTWLFPATTATLLGTITLAFIYFLMYRQDRTRFFRLWTIGWVVYAVRFLAMLLLLGFPKTGAVMMPVVQSATHISSLLLLAGTFSFLDRAMPRFVYVAFSAILLWVVLASFFSLSFTVYTLPNFLFTGFVYIWTGYVWLRHLDFSGLGKYLVGIVFILWGVHKLDYPILRPVLSFAPWGYGIGALLELLLAFGIIQVYFERTRARLKLSLSEQETLLKEVHHRVKNNLQIISSLLGLQAAALDDERLSNIIRVSQNRIRSMSLAHEKLYHTTYLSSIDFHEYCESLVMELVSNNSRHGRQISLDNSTDHINIDLETAIPCGLIINELVSNSLNHAFREKSEGKVSLLFRKESDDHLRMTVRDDGCGLPDTIRIEQAETMGLQLVNLLVRQLNGSLEVNTESGTTVDIVFPVSRRTY